MWSGLVRWEPPCAAARGSLKRPDAALCVISVLRLRVDGVERVPTARVDERVVGNRSLRRRHSCPFADGAARNPARASLSNRF